MSKPHAMGEERARLLRLATRASVGVALVLIALKATVWLTTGSVSLLAGLIDSLIVSANAQNDLISVSGDDLLALRAVRHPGFFAQDTVDTYPGGIGPNQTVADGAVVGSAIVKLIGEGKAPGEVLDFVKGLADGAHAA